MKGLDIHTATGDLSGIADNNDNLGIVYFHLREYKRAWSHLENAIRLSGIMFFHSVPDQHKLFL